VTETKRPHHKEKTDFLDFRLSNLFKIQKPLKIRNPRFKNPKTHVEISFRVCDDLDGFPSCLSRSVTGPKYQHVEMPLTICRVGEGLFFFSPYTLTLINNPVSQNLEFNAKKEENSSPIIW
jgi:hypothetical protein